MLSDAMKAVAVAVAQSVERPFRSPSKRFNSLTDVGSNPGHGIRWLEKSRPCHLWAKMEISAQFGKDNENKLFTMVRAYVVDS